MAGSPLPAGKLYSPVSFSSLTAGWGKEGQAFCKISKQAKGNFFELQWGWLTQTAGLAPSWTV